jgi:hypothetical protein
MLFPAFSLRDCFDEQSLIHPGHVAPVVDLFHLAHDFARDHAHLARMQIRLRGTKKVVVQVEVLQLALGVDDILLVALYRSYVVLTQD